MEVKAHARVMDTTHAKNHRYYHTFQCIYRAFIEETGSFEPSVLVTDLFTNGSLWNTQ